MLAFSSPVSVGLSASGQGGLIGETAEGVEVGILGIGSAQVGLDHFGWDWDEQAHSTEGGVGVLDFVCPQFFHGHIASV